MLTGHWSRVPRPIVLGLMLAAVVAMVLVRASVLVGCGLVAGAFAAWYLSAASRAFLFGLEPPDPRAFAGAGASLLLASLIASAIPARRSGWSSRRRTLNA